MLLYRHRFDFGTLPEKLHAIAAAGYQGWKFSRTICSIIRDAGGNPPACRRFRVKNHAFQPFRDFEGASRAQFAANMARARRKFALMRELAARRCCCAAMYSRTARRIANCRSRTCGRWPRWRKRRIAIGYEATAREPMNRWQQARERCGGWTARRWAGARQLPYSGPRRHAGRATVGAGGENHLCTARRCAVYENGFAGWSRHFRCFPGQGAAAGGVCRADHPLWLPRPGRWRSSMTVSRLAERRDGQRWLSFAAVAGGQTRRRLPTCDADLFSPPPLPVYHGLEFIEFAASAAEAQRTGNICRRWVFSTRKPPLQTGDAVAQRRGADRHQPSAAQLGRPFLSTPRGIALRDGAAGRAQRVACRPRPRAGVCHGRATPGRTKRRSRRSAPTAALSISSTPGRLSTSAIFICVMA